jgi:hypothetical protein
MLHRLAESNSSESIPGLLKRLQTRALTGRYDNPIPPRFLAPIDSLKIPALRGGDQEVLNKVIQENPKTPPIFIFTVTR